MPKAICFMIMPYGRKATQGEPSSNVPGEVDFDALWDRAFAPTIASLGYESVRADQDTGALIVNQMIERLYFADLVLADMTIPNGNVYYGVGLRHAAKKTGCVLLASDWSKQLFDAAQLRTLRYPMPEGDITTVTAAGIVSAIRDPIAKLAKGASPMHEAIRGYPYQVDETSASTMNDVMAAMAAFQGEISAVRLLPDASQMARAKELVTQYWKTPVTPPTALALVLLMKKSAGNADDWTWITDFIGKLPADEAEQEEVRELNAFALFNAGKPIDAIAKLKALIALSWSGLPCLVVDTSAFTLARRRRQKRLDISPRVSRPTNGAWSSTSTNIIARAICRVSTKPESAKATTTARDRFRLWSSPHAKERKSAAGQTNGCTRPCSAPRSTWAMPRRPRKSPSTSQRSATHRGL
jgi:hypothetical protein